METSRLTNFNQLKQEISSIGEEMRSAPNADSRFLDLVEKLDSGITEDEIFELRTLTSTLGEEDKRNSAVQEGLKKWKACISSSVANSLIRELKKEIENSSITLENHRLLPFLKNYFTGLTKLVTVYTTRKSDQNSQNIWNRFRSHLLFINQQEKQFKLGDKRFLRYFFSSSVQDFQYLLTERMESLVPASILHKQSMTQIVAPAMVTKQNDGLRECVVMYNSWSEAFEATKCPGGKFNKEYDLSLFYKKNFFNLFLTDYTRLEIAAFRLALFGKLPQEERHHINVNIRFYETSLPEEFRIADWGEYSSFIGQDCTAAIVLQSMYTENSEKKNILRGSIVGVKRSNGTYMFGIVVAIDKQEATILFRNKNQKKALIKNVITFADDVLNYIRFNPGVLLVGKSVPAQLISSLENAQEEDLNLGGVCVVTRSSGGREFALIERIIEKDDPIVGAFLRTQNNEQEKVIKMAKASSVRTVAPQKIVAYVEPLSKEDKELIEEKLYDGPCCSRLARIIGSVASVELSKEQEQLFDLPLVFGSFMIENERQIKEFTQNSEKYYGIFGNVSIGKEIHAIFCEEKQVEGVRRLLGPLLDKSGLHIPILSFDVARFHELRRLL